MRKPPFFCTGIFHKTRIQPLFPQLAAFRRCVPFNPLRFIRQLISGYDLTFCQFCFHKQFPQPVHIFHSGSQQKSFRAVFDLPFQITQLLSVHTVNGRIMIAFPNTSSQIRYRRNPRHNMQKSPKPSVPDFPVQCLIQPPAPAIKTTVAGHKNHNISIF